MKKAVIQGERRAALIDADTPEPRVNWVVVKVHVAPMCAEYKQYIGGGIHEHLGHEAAGEVVAVAQPGRVKVGDRVVAMPLSGCGTCALCVSGNYIHCEQAPSYASVAGTPEGQGTMSQYILKQDWLLPRIPDGVSYEHAALACCGLGPSFGAFRSLGVRAYDTVLITGAGPVGLGALVNAQFMGARAIVVESVPVLDPRSDTVIQDIHRLTNGVGVDYALDCSGTIAAERLCIDGTRRKGAVAYIGECNQDLAIRVSPDLIRKGLTVMGSWHYNLADFPKIMNVIQRSPLIDMLISHTLPMSEIQAAFELSASHQTAKILLHPWE
jgi:L-iditol 2-dehydrogenase